MPTGIGPRVCYQCYIALVAGSNAYSVPYQFRKSLNCCRFFRDTYHSHQYQLWCDRRGVVSFWQALCNSIRSFQACTALASCTVQLAAAWQITIPLCCCCTSRLCLLRNDESVVACKLIRAYCTYFPCHLFASEAKQTASQGTCSTMLATGGPDVFLDQYFGPCGFRELWGPPCSITFRNPASTDVEKQKELWRFCERVTQFTYPLWNRRLLIYWKMRL